MGQTNSTSEILPDSHQSVLASKLREWPLDQAKSLFQTFRKLQLDYGIVQSQFSKWLSTAQANNWDSEFQTEYKPKVIADQLFSTLDSDENGRIDCLEFLSGVAMLSTGHTKDKLRFIFELFDFNANGSLSPFEIALMMKSTVLATEKIASSGSSGSRPRDPFEEKHVTETEVEAVTREAFRVYDKDRNQKLSFQEYYAWLGGCKPIVQYLMQFSTVPRNPNEKLTRFTAPIKQRSVARAMEDESAFEASTVELRHSTPPEAIRLYSAHTRAMEQEPLSFVSKHRHPPRATLVPEWVYGKASTSVLVLDGAGDAAGENRLLVYGLGKYVVVFHNSGGYQELYQGHQACVTAVASFGQQGLVASSARGGLDQSSSEVHVWNASTPQVSGSVWETFHEFPVAHICFSRNGNLLATVGSGNHGAVKIWNWRTRQHLITIPNVVGEAVLGIDWLVHDSPCYVVCYEHVAEVVVLEHSARSHTVGNTFENPRHGGLRFQRSVIEVSKTDATPLSSSLGDGLTQAALFSSVTSVGENFVLGTNSGSILLLDATAQVLHRQTSAGGSVSSLCEWSRGIVSGSTDGSLRMWDLKLVPIQCVPLENGLLSGATVSSVTSSPAGDLLAAWSVDGKVHLLDGNSEATCFNVGACWGPGPQIACHPWLPKAIVCQQDGLGLLDLEEHAQVRATDTQCTAVTYHPDGSLVAAALAEFPSTIVLMDEASLAVLSSTSLAQSATLAVTSLCFSPTRDLLAAGTSQGQVVLIQVKHSWQGRTQLHKSVVCGPSTVTRAPIIAVDWSLDSAFIRGGTRDHRVCVWSSHGEEQVGVLVVREIPWSSATCVGGWDTSGLLFPGREAKEELCGLPGTLVEDARVDDSTCVAASSSSDGVRLLLTGSRTGDIALHHLPCLQHKASSRFPAHQGPVDGVVMSAGGRFALSCSREDGIGIQWRVTDSSRRLARSAEDELTAGESDSECSSVDSEIDFDLEEEQSQYLLAESNAHMVSLKPKEHLGPPTEAGLNLDSSSVSELPVAIFSLNSSVDFSREVETVNLEWIIGSTCGTLRNAVQFLSDGAQVVYPSSTFCTISSTRVERAESNTLTKAPRDPHCEYLPQDGEGVVNCLDTWCGPAGDVLAVGLSQMTNEPARVLIWNPKRSLVKARLRCPWKGSVCKVAFSPQGTRLLVIGTDAGRSIAVFDWSSGRVIASSTKNHIEPTMAICWIDETKFVTGGIRQVLFWSISGSELGFSNGTISRELENYRSLRGALCLERLPEQASTRPVTKSMQVVAGTKSGSLVVWDATSMTPTGHILGAHDGSILAMGCSAPHSLLATGGNDGKVKVWYLEDFSPAIGSVSTTLRAIDAKPITLPAAQPAAAVSPITAVDIGDSDRRHSVQVLKATRGNQLQVIDLQLDQDAVLLPEPTDWYTLMDESLHDSVVAVAGHPQLPIGFTGGIAGVLRVWNLETKTLVCKRNTETPCTSMDCSPTGNQVAIGSSEGNILIYSMEDGSGQSVGAREMPEEMVSESPMRVVEVEGNPGASVSKIRYSPSAEYCAVAVESGGVIVYRTDNWTVSQILQSESNLHPIVGLDWAEASNPGGRVYLRTLDECGKILQWNVSSGVLLSNPTLVRKHWTTMEGSSLAAMSRVPICTSQTGASIAYPVFGANGLTIQISHDQRLSDICGIGDSTPQLKGDSSNAVDAEVRQSGISFAAQDRFVLFSWDGHTVQVLTTNNLLANLARAKEAWKALTPEEREKKTTEYESRLQLINSSSQQHSFHSSTSIRNKRFASPQVRKAYKRCFEVKRQNQATYDFLPVPSWIHGFRTTGGRSKVTLTDTCAIWPAGPFVVCQTYTSREDQVGQVPSIEQRFYTCHTNEVLAVAVSQDCRNVLSTERGNNALIHVWEVETLSTIRKINLSRDIHMEHNGISNLVFNPEGDTIVALLSDKDATLLLINWQDGSLQQAIPTFVGIPSDLHWLPTQQHLTNSAHSRRMESRNPRKLSVGPGPVVTGDSGTVYTTMQTGRGNQFSILRGRPNKNASLNPAATAVTASIVLELMEPDQRNRVSNGSFGHYNINRARDGPSRRIRETFVVTGHVDGSLALWDEFGVQRKPVGGHTGPVLSLVQAEDENEKSFVRQLCKSIKVDDGFHNTMGFQGSFLSAGTDGQICCWDSSMILIGKFNLPNCGPNKPSIAEVCSLSLCPDSSELCVGLSDGSILLAQFPSLVPGPTARLAPVWKVLNSGHVPMSRCFVDDPQETLRETLPNQHSWDKLSARVLDTSLVAAFQGGSGGCLAFTGARGVGIRCWDLGAHSLRLRFDDPNVSGAFVVLPSLGQIVAGTRSGKLKVFKLDLTPAKLPVRSCVKSEITCMELGPAGKVIAVGCASGEVAVVSSQGLRTLQVTKEHHRPLVKVKWSSTGSKLWAFDDQGMRREVEQSGDVVKTRNAQSELAFEAGEEPIPKMLTMGPYLMQYDKHMCP